MLKLHNRIYYKFKFNNLIPIPNPTLPRHYTNNRSLFTLSHQCHRRNDKPDDSESKEYEMSDGPRSGLTSTIESQAGNSKFQEQSAKESMQTQQTHSRPQGPFPGVTESGLSQKGGQKVGPNMRETSGTLQFAKEKEREGGVDVKSDEDLNFAKRGLRPFGFTKEFHHSEHLRGPYVKRFIRDKRDIMKELTEPITMQLVLGWILGIGGGYYLLLQQKNSDVHKSEKEHMESTHGTISKERNELSAIEHKMNKTNQILLAQHTDAQQLLLDHRNKEQELKKQSFELEQHLQELRGQRLLLKAPEDENPHFFQPEELEYRRNLKNRMQRSKEEILELSKIVQEQPQYGQKLRVKLEQFVKEYVEQGEREMAKQVEESQNREKQKKKELGLSEQQNVQLLEDKSNSGSQQTSSDQQKQKQQLIALSQINPYSSLNKDNPSQFYLRFQDQNSEFASKTNKVLEHAAEKLKLLNDLDEGIQKRDIGKCESALLALENAQIQAGSKKLLAEVIIMSGKTDVQQTDPSTKSESQDSESSSQSQTNKVQDESDIESKFRKDSRITTSTTSSSSSNSSSDEIDFFQKDHVGPTLLKIEEGRVGDILKQIVGVKKELKYVQNQKDSIAFKKSQQDSDNNIDSDANNDNSESKSTNSTTSSHALDTALLQHEQSLKAKEKLLREKLRDRVVARTNQLVDSEKYFRLKLSEKSNILLEQFEQKSNELLKHYLELDQQETSREIDLTLRREFSHQEQERLEGEMYEQLLKASIKEKDARKQQFNELQQEIQREVIEIKNKQAGLIEQYKRLLGEMYDIKRDDDMEMKVYRKHDDLKGLVEGVVRKWYRDSDQTQDLNQVLQPIVQQTDDLILRDIAVAGIESADAVEKFNSSSQQQSSNTMRKQDQVITSFNQNLNTWVRACFIQNENSMLSHAYGNVVGSLYRIDGHPGVDQLQSKSNCNRSQDTQTTESGLGNLVQGGLLKTLNGVTTVVKKLSSTVTANDFNLNEVNFENVQKLISKAISESRSTDSASDSSSNSSNNTSKLVASTPKTSKLEEALEVLNRAKYCIDSVAHQDSETYNFNDSSTMKSNNNSKSNFKSTAPSTNIESALLLLDDHINSEEKLNSSEIKYVHSLLKPWLNEAKKAVIAEKTLTALSARVKCLHATARLDCAGETGGGGGVGNIIRRGRPGY